VIEGRVNERRGSGSDREEANDVADRQVKNTKARILRRLADPRVQERKRLLEEERESNLEGIDDICEHQFRQVSVQSIRGDDRGESNTPSTENLASFEENEPNQDQLSVEPNKKIRNLSALKWLEERCKISTSKLFIDTNSRSSAVEETSDLDDRGEHTLQIHAEADDFLSSRFF
jgi:hypothetical protein